MSAQNDIGPPPAYFEMAERGRPVQADCIDILDATPSPTASPSTITYIQGTRIQDIPPVSLDGPPVVVGVPVQQVGEADIDVDAIRIDESSTDVESSDDPLSADYSSVEQQQRRKKKKKKKKKKIYWIKHRVQPHDTLAGICLRYDVEASMLKRLNRFTADHFWMKEYLVVPVTDPKLGRAEDAVELDPELQAKTLAKKRERQERTLALLGQLTGSEAKSYLKLHNYNMKKALAALKADQEWEEAGKPVRVPTVEDQVHPRFKN